MSAEVSSSSVADLAVDTEMSVPPAMDVLSLAPEISTSHDDEEQAAKKKKKKSVGFSQEVRIRVLPDEEADEAFVTRKGEWGSAPDHDELWDGDSKVFWDQEKTLEEVHRIVVMRQLRLTVQYNLGFAFYGMVANFKRRRNCLSNEDVIPQFETPASEDVALRKELRELFQDSVKGLEYQDLIQDRIAFERIYATLSPGLGGVETLIDEILNIENICILMNVPLDIENLPEETQEAAIEPNVSSGIEDAVDELEKRRGEQRAVFEAQNNGVPAYGERRASVEARRLADAIAADQELAAIQAAERILPPVEEIHENVAVETTVPASSADLESASEPQLLASPADPTTTTANVTTVPEPAVLAPVVGLSATSAAGATGRKFAFPKPGTGSAGTAADIRVFAEVFEGTTISTEDRIKYSQRFMREGITSVKQLAALSTSNLTVLEVKVFDAKQIVRRSWVLTRRV